MGERVGDGRLLVIDVADDEGGLGVEEEEALDLVREHLVLLRPLLERPARHRPERQLRQVAIARAIGIGCFPSPFRVLPMLLPSVPSDLISNALLHRATRRDTRLLPPFCNYDYLVFFVLFCFALLFVSVQFVEFETGGSFRNSRKLRIPAIPVITFDGRKTEMVSHTCFLCLFFQKPCILYKIKALVFSAFLIIFFISLKTHFNKLLQ